MEEVISNEYGNVISGKIFVCNNGVWKSMTAIHDLAECQLMSGVRRGKLKKNSSYWHIRKVREAPVNRYREHVTNKRSQRRLDIRYLNISKL